MSWFDRFAAAAAGVVARAPFFVGCVLLVVAWLPTLALIPVDTSQLIINTATTIVTFLLVALLQNAQTRGDAATQEKLNQIAAFLARMAEHEFGSATEHDVAALRRAVGLEEEMSA